MEEGYALGYLPWVTMIGAVVAAIVSIASLVVSLKSALDVDSARRRQETMELLRWAVEQAASESEYRSQVGTTTLGELLRTRFILKQDKEFVRAIAAIVEAASADLVEDFEEGKLAIRTTKVPEQVKESGA